MHKMGGVTQPVKIGAIESLQKKQNVEEGRLQFGKKIDTATTRDVAGGSMPGFDGAHHLGSLEHPGIVAHQPLRSSGLITWNC